MGLVLNIYLMQQSALKLTVFVNILSRYMLLFSINYGLLPLFLKIYFFPPNK